MGTRRLLVSEGGPPLPRLLESALIDRLRRIPVVVLTGARQTGKTTLVQSFPGAEERAFATLDSIATLDRAKRQPEDLAESAPRLTIDEVQRVPELLLAVKKIVDAGRRNGRFLLTGSANLLLLRRVSESLAGRAVHLVLRPMTEREKRGDQRPPIWSALLSARDLDSALKMIPPHRPGFDWRKAAVEGGFPPAVLSQSPEDRDVWFQGFIDTYLHRDLRDLAHVGDLAAFARLLRLIGLRAGGLLNVADLARDAEIPRGTAQRWLSILDASYLITLLHPFATSRAKRLIKAPKIYPGDAGVFLHLAGIADPEGFERAPNTGAWLETVVLNDLLAWRETEIHRPDVFHWRTATDQEIDFVVERGSRLLPIEVKAAKGVRIRDASALDAFCAEHGRSAPFGLLLYDGKEGLRLTKSVVAAPLSAVL
jgi:predicted AAA+ superfamily ATPase